MHVTQDADKIELRLSLDKLNSSNSSASQTSKHSECTRSGNGKHPSDSVQNVTEYKDTHQEMSNLHDKIEKESIHARRAESVEKANKSWSKASWANLGTTSQKSVQRTIASVSTGDKCIHNSQNSDSQAIQKSISLKIHHSLKEEQADAISDDKSVRSNAKEQPDITELSLDERMDLLIAGERARERLEDAEIAYTDNVKFVKPGDSYRKQIKSSPLSPKGTESVCTTTTFTSITSDSSDFSSEFQLELEREKKQKEKLSFNASSTNSATANSVLVPQTMIDSTDSVTSIDMFTLTSDSTSYWWDVEDENDDVAPSNRGHMNSDRLKPLEEGHVTNDEIRRQRVIQHIKALQRTR